MAKPKSKPATPARPPRTGVLRAVEYVVGPLEWRTLRDWIVLITGILVFWWLIAQPFRIPSGSMEPTLHGGNFVTGDRVFVNKLSYGIRVPFTNKRLVTWGGPNRWDILVFKSVEPETPNKILIKRVVGLPGDRILIRNKNIYLFNKESGYFEREEVPEGAFEPRYVSADDLDFFIEQTDNDMERRMLIDMRSRYPLKYACVEEPEFMNVPEGHYLMLGDNSLQSVDGRIYGWVAENHILGRATCIWWPLSRLRDFTGWTGTWWGVLLLIAIPGGLIGMEVHRYVRKRRAKLASAGKPAA